MTSTATLTRHRSPLAPAPHPHPPFTPGYRDGLPASRPSPCRHPRHRISPDPPSRHPEKVPTIAVFVALFCTAVTTFVLTGQAVVAAVFSLWS
jgi:hypothetical protein